MWQKWQLCKFWALTSRAFALCHLLSWTLAFFHVNKPRLTFWKKTDCVKQNHEISAWGPGYVRKLKISKADLKLSHSWPQMHENLAKAESIQLNPTSISDPEIATNVQHHDYYAIIGKNVLDKCVLAWKRYQLSMLNDYPSQKEIQK